MNRIYRLVFNKRFGQLIPVAEISKRNRKGDTVGHSPGAKPGVELLCRSLALLSLGPCLALSCTLAWAGTLPTGGAVAVGSGTIDTSAHTMTVQQHSQRLGINWQSFSIGSGDAVVFHQPNASSVALNRVLGGSRSEIYGRLSANGRVFLVNPNGVLFGRTAEVNVGGLLATTGTISDSDFAAGKYTFTGGGNAEVVNEGNLKAVDGGFVVLAANTVRNTGSIIAPGGTAALAAGETVSLSLDNSAQLSVRVDGATLQALVDNQGLVAADGGSVVLTARGKQMLEDSAVNLKGTLQARSIDGKTGRIVIDGGDSDVTIAYAKIDVSGADSGEKGGSVTVTGKDISLENTTIDASGDAGGGTVRVGGDSKGQGTLPHAEAVTMAADSTIDASATRQGDGGSVVLFSDGATTFAGSIAARGGTQGGDGGQVETSGQKLHVADGAQVDTLAAAGRSGTWLIDPTDFTISSSGAQTSSGIGADTLESSLASGNVILQTDNSSGTGNGDINVDAAVSWSAATTLTLEAYADININADISASAGTLKLYYGQGTSDGGTSGYSLSNSAQVDLSAGNHFYTRAGSSGTETAWTVITTLGTNPTSTTGLQGINGGLSGDYVLGADINASATSSWDSGKGFEPLGNDSTPFSGQFDGLGHVVSGLVINRSNTSYVGLFGYAASGSSIANLGLEGGSVTGSDRVGGLVGYSDGSVSNSYATGAVTGSFMTGGLVGYSGGSVNDSHATGNVSGGIETGGLVGYLEKGTISGSYATTGAVTGNSNDVGGLVGFSSGSTISNSYATGAVTGKGSNIGGLVGSDGTDTISNSYATGAVTGSNNHVGGLVGYSSGSTISNSYATGKVEGDNYTGGLVGYGIVDISNSYATGNVTGDGTGNSNAIYTGGLVGYYASGTISGSYATTGAITGVGHATNGGYDRIGGLVGENHGTISNSYATGAVTGWSEVGGLVGQNQGTIDYSYAAGAVNGGSSGGGLVAYNDGNGSVSNSFWDKTTTGQSGGYASNHGTFDATGLTTDEMKTFANFNNAGWDISASGGSSAVWRIYEGDTYPLLRSFLTPLSITANSGSRTYDGTTNDLGVTYSATPDSSLLFGTLSDGSTASKDVGSYSVTPSGQYSDQEGYDIEYVTGTVQISAKTLTVGGTTSAADKVYDGTTDANVSGGTISGVISGDSASLAQSGSFNTKNVGSAKPVSYTNSLGGTDAGNYVLDTTGGTTTASITAKTLTVGGTTSAADKVYDGTTDATVSGGTLSTVVTGDDVSLVQSGSFDTKNVGNGKTVSYTDSLGGTDAGNYVLDTTSGTTTADITPATLIITANDASKTFDGQPYSGGNGVSYSGFVSGEGRSVLTGTLTYGGNSQGAINIGAYSIVPGGLSSSNYDMTFVDGQLRINPGDAYHAALSYADNTVRNLNLPFARPNMPLNQPGNGLNANNAPSLRIVGGGIRSLKATEILQRSSGRRDRR